MNNGEDIVIKKHEHSNIRKGSVICLVGSRGSGKSVAVKTLCYHFRDIPHFVVVSKTERNNKFFSEFIPPSCIYYDWDPSILRNLFDLQDHLIQKYGKEDPRTHSVLVLDDCLCDKKLWKQKEIVELLMNGRHKNITFIFTLQYSIGISPELRVNIDFPFIFAQETLAEKKKIFEHYVGVFETFKEFRTVLDIVTENYCCLVVNKTKKSKDVQQKVFRYRAPMKTPPFKVGDPYFWTGQPADPSRKIVKDGKTILLE